MFVRQLLASKGYGVIGTTSTTTVYDALAAMAEAGVGALPVIDDGKLSGMFSERDYARKIILQGRRSRETAVHEIMSAPVITVDPSDTIERCMELMTDSRIRHLPVVEEAKVVAMVSIGDVVKVIMQQQAMMIEQLESYIDRR
jgi:CBS domain-containing protein